MGFGRLALGRVVTQNSRLTGLMKNGFRVARAPHQQGNEAHALRLLGGVHAARGNDGQAEKVPDPSSCPPRQASDAAARIDVGFRVLAKTSRPRSPSSPHSITRLSAGERTRAA